MGLFQDLMKDLMHSGPENFKKLLDVAERLPAEETLLKLASSLDRWYPYLPLLEKLSGDGSLSGLERALARIPSASTLDKLSSTLPLLEKLPDERTINKFLEKADGLQKFIESLEGS